MKPTTLVTPGDWPTRELRLPPTAVDWPPVVVPSRAARHQQRARRRARAAQRIIVGLGLATFTAIVSLALYVGGWSP